MNHDTCSHEQVGNSFSENDLQDAQRRAWKALDETAAKIKPGHSEKDAGDFLKESLKANDCEKIWHPPQIRFGINTLKSFGEKSDASVVLTSEDLFFLDIGPVFGGHEGDVGRTFVVGANLDHLRIAADAKKVFEATRNEWLTKKLSGRSLYDFAQNFATTLGWEIGYGGASGHRVSDFPHAVHYRGKLKTQEHCPASNRWILEIHLLDPKRRFGAFFEDLL